MRATAKYLLLNLFLFVLTACGGGGGSDSAAPANPATPSIASFTSSAATIVQGESVTLTATFSGGTGSINNGVGAITSGASITISPSASTTYTLTVTNTAGSSVTRAITVTVDTAPPTNIPPIVNAANDLSAYERELVELSSIATDADGTVEQYLWEQISGPHVTLNSPAESTTTFGAPPVATRTVLEFAITVTDSESAQSSDQVAVAIHPLAEFGGPVLQDTVLSGAYEIISDVSVAPNTTLTLSPGTILKFPRALTPGYDFSVSGQLVADGTEEQPIYFTYLELWDVTPSSSWSGIKLVDSPNSTITYSIIENATNGVKLNGNSPILIQNNVFRDNSVAVTDDYGYQAMQVNRNSFVRNYSVFEGIRLTGNSLFSENVFEDNPLIFARGFYFDTTTIEQNSFEGADLVIRAPESGYGYGTVTAMNNWWGTTSEAEITATITDINDDATLQQIVYVPILDAAPALAGSALPSDLDFPRPDFNAGVDGPAESGPPSGPPTSLSANETFLAIMLTWDNPSLNLQNVEVWRSTENSLLAATLIGTSVSPQYVDEVGASASFYYWVRAVGTNGAHSAFNDTVGTLGTTGVNP